MQVGIDLAWGAIVLSLIKQWIRASDADVLGGVPRYFAPVLWVASCCGCFTPLVEESVSGSESMTSIFLL